MTNVTCTRRIAFDAGHRIYGHESKCANMHGHGYEAFFHAQAPALDSLGRVIDFSVLKEQLGGWIDQHWDHGFLYYTKDLSCKTLFQSDERFVGQKSYECPFNPTAEEMANFLLQISNSLLPSEITVVKVVLWETENCFAEASL